MTEGLAPPGWPVPHVLPPGVDRWQETAIAWLLDCAGVADWRGVEVLTRFPVVLARLVAEHIAADVTAARQVWGEIDQLVGSAGVAVSDQEGVAAALRSMLEREGPKLVARARAAGLLAEALQGNRWVPRL